MPKLKRPKRKRPPDRVDRLCEAIALPTAGRASRTYAAQWVRVHSAARQLGVSEADAGHSDLAVLADPPV